jgi:hypothetical protein
VTTALSGCLAGSFCLFLPLPSNQMCFSRQVTMCLVNFPHIHPPFKVVLMVTTCRYRYEDVQGKAGRAEAHLC